MSHPTPLQSFLGGIALTVPIQFLLTLNGDVFGISGFLHNAVRRDKEGLTSVAGLLLGGAIIGAVEGVGPQKMSVGLPWIALSGLLVGVGTKVRDLLLRFIVTMTEFDHIFLCSFPMVVPQGDHIFTMSSYDGSLTGTNRRHMLCGISRFSTR